MGAALRAGGGVAVRALASALRFHKLQAAGACVGMRQASRTRMGFGLRSAPQAKDLNTCADINIKEYV